MFVLREISSKAGWASIRSRDHLGDIMKITSKKKRPQIITFTLSAKAEKDQQRRSRFVIPDAEKSIHKLKEHLIKSFGDD